MSCKACEEFQVTGEVYWYRWGNANIGIFACKAHAMQVIEALREIQLVNKYIRDQEYLKEKQA